MSSRMRIPAVIATAAAMLIAFSAGGSETRAGNAEPVIHSVDPSTAREWSYVTILGENLVSGDGSCSVEIAGLRSFVSTCDDSQILAIVPWNAASGDVVVFANDKASNPVHINIFPADQPVPGEEIVAGVIHVKMDAGIDITIVLEREGAPPESATPINPDSPNLADWYGVTVPVGTEVAESRAYSVHPEVLYVGPVPLPFIDPPPVPTPSPTLIPQSTITIRFVRNGEPLEVTLSSPPSPPSADGVTCPHLQPAVVVVRSQHVELWPLTDGEQPVECRKGPPTTLRFEYLAHTPDLGETVWLTAEVEWTGTDLVTDIEVPAEYVVTPTPTSSPSPTPAQLPDVGGAPNRDSSNRWPVALGLALVGAIGGLWLCRRAVVED